MRKRKYKPSGGRIRKDPVDPLMRQLRDVLDNCGMTYDEVLKKAGYNSALLRRWFAMASGPLTLNAINIIAGIAGYKLVLVPKDNLGGKNEAHNDNLRRRDGEDVAGIADGSDVHLHSGNADAR